MIFFSERHSGELRPPLKRQTRKNLLRVCYSTHVPLLTWGGDDGSDEEAHIRSEGRTNAEAPRGGTQGSGNAQATGDRRQGRSDTEKEQSLGGYQKSAPAKADWLWHILYSAGML